MYPFPKVTPQRLPLRLHQLRTCQQCQQHHRLRSCQSCQHLRQRRAPPLLLPLLLFFFHKIDSLKECVFLYLSRMIFFEGRFITVTPSHRHNRQHWSSDRTPVDARGDSYGLQFDRNQWRRCDEAAALTLLQRTAQMRCSCR